MNWVRFVSIIFSLTIAKAPVFAKEAHLQRPVYKVCIGARVDTTVNKVQMKIFGKGAQNTMDRIRIKAVSPFASYVSGHSYVTFVRTWKGEKPKVLRSYGYWPDFDGSNRNGSLKKDYSNLKINNGNDQKIANRFGSKFKHKEFCTEVHRSKLRKLDKIAKEYDRRYGNYGALFNNCVHFASRVFSEFTNYSIRPSTATPSSLMKAIDIEEKAMRKFHYMKDSYSEGISIADAIESTH